MSRLEGIDIANLPGAEDDQFEYKSSTTPINALKDKLGRAASGFWNSCGGIFIAGVDDTGKPDGGVVQAVGRTSIRDWADQVLLEVSPLGTYAVRTFPHDPATSLKVVANCCVLAVEFERSARPPHMAPDHKYYIRAGAHTVPATQYILEALWARRRLQRPQLAHTMRLKPEASDIIQLVVLALTDEPATNITISLDPLPEMWKDSKAVFPLRLPLLDRTTPFHLDVTTYFAAGERLGPDVRLRIGYQDLGGNHYDYAATLDIKSIAPWKIGTPANEKMAGSLDSIDKTLQKVPTALKELQDENAELRSLMESLQSTAFPRRDGEPGAIAAQLGPDASALMLAAKKDGTIIFTPYIGGSQLSAGGTAFISSVNDHREQARWRSTISEIRNIGLIEGVFERGTSSLFRLTNLGYKVADAVSPKPERATGGEGAVGT
jgi:hypothetical protein